MRRALPLAALLAAAPGPLAAQGAAYEQLQAFSGVLNHVRTNYVDPVAYPELVRASIDGMLRALDPHSYFSSRADWERMSALERGELAVVGLQLEDGDRNVVVLGVVADGPAERAGVAPGDRLLAVDDTVVAGRRAAELTLRLAGSKGSKVRLRLERGPALAPETYAVTLKRDDIRTSAVPEGRLLGDRRTGWVRLQEFDVQAAEDLRREIRRLKKAGAGRIVLDLRRNPGGLVMEAVDIAALFLPADALVFSTHGRKRAVEEEFRTKKAGEFVDLPLAVLVDAASASASEALAGSLQDHDRALLVGRRTFGKALMQAPFIVAPTGDVVWLTVGRVATPSGRIIQRAYRGLGVEQYRSLAGQGGAEADTAAVFRTAAGRVVRGGGGIQPDVEVPAPADLPAWWGAAADSGMTLAVADSAGTQLGADQAAWVADRAAWDVLLVRLLERSRARFGRLPDPEPEERERMAWLLARRAASVRWPDGSTAFEAATDPDILAALSRMDRLPELLTAK
jgi:carboxyl-terminal processing protease